MILDDIIFDKRQEVTSLKVRLDVKRASQAIKKLPKTRPFAKALKQKKGVALIAEIKKASPSAGVLVKNFNPVKIAKQYKAAGAAALSILTDAKYFKGQLAYLKKVRAAVKLPILRKDFIIDESQIYESRLNGADAILLIVRVLSDEQLKNYIHLAKSLGLSCLVEVHNGHEVVRAIRANAKIIGINNRDLSNFKTDWQKSLDLIKHYPELKKTTIVSESGLHQGEQIRQLGEKGVAAVLVGESLLKAKDLKQKIKELMGS